MKITLLAYDLSHNSLVRTHVLAQLLQQDHTVEIVGPMSTGTVWAPLREKYDYKGVQTRSRLWEFPLHAPELLDLISGDVVYARKPKATSYGLGLYDRLASDRPLLLDIEDWELGLMYSNWSRLRAPLAGVPRLIDLNSYYYTWLMEALVDRADAVTVSNRFLSDRFGGTLVPHVRDTTAFDPSRFETAALRRELGLPAEETLVMFTGTPRPHKGVAELAEAVAMLDRPDVGLVVVGAPESESAFTDRLRRIAGDRLTLIGPQPFDDVPKWVAAGDIVAVPQKQTPGLHGQIPAKAFDAMALGKPVVATDVSDLREVLDGGALFVDEPTPGALADRLRTLVDDPALRRDLGKTGRRRAVAEYSLEAYRPVINDLVESAVDSR